MQDPNRIHILTFHGLGTPGRILPAGEENYWLDGAFFEEILDYLKDRPDVFITFDDSNRSDYEIALPALLKRKLTASFFIVSERIDQPGCLTTTQIREMALHGMGIGSHGTKHRPWATLNAKELASEVNDSRSALEDLLGRPVLEAACPNGSYNRRVLHALRTAGYRRVYTSDDGPARRDEWLSARNTIRKVHALPHVTRVLASVPTGLPALLRSVKLRLKRWR